MNISLFDNVGEVTNPQILDIIDYLNDTRDGYWHKIVMECRSITDYEERKAFKKKMPTACLSGSFTYRDDKSIVTHSGIIAIDLDDLDNVQSVKNQLALDKYVFSVFLSTSGNGLRVLFKIEPNRHKDAFRSICQYLYSKYKVSADTNSSVSKPYIVSFDSELYLNEDSQIFLKYVKETVIKNIPVYIHNNDDFENIFKQIIGRNIDICQNYDDWVHLGFGIAEAFGEKGRYYFHELSKISSLYKPSRCNYQYDVSLRRNVSGEKRGIRTFYYLAKLAGVNIVSEKTKEVVRITRNSKKAGLKPSQISNNLKEKAGIEGVDDLINKVYESDDNEGFEEESESILQILELFIKNSYSLRFNEISGFFEDHGHQVTPTAMNSIFIAAKKLLPKLDYNLMIRLLKSDFIEVYNPLFEFWKSDGIPVILPPNPEEQKKFNSPIIDRLADCIENKDTAFTRYFLRKWLVSIVSAAHKVHSPLLFCLLGPQGSGKTEFFRRLFPKELSHYYAESKLDKEKDDELLMTENLVIMDDELGGKSKADALKLKNITSKQWFSLRRPYGDHNEKILRLAVLCGTSNYKQIMSDDTGNRRIIPVWVENIDKVKYNSIDKTELFMEMFRLYKEGFDWRINTSDLDLLNKDSELFTVVVKERELINKYFLSFDEERLSSTEILVELEQLTGQRLSLNIVGRELENLGFIRKSTRVGADKKKVSSLWCVQKINRNIPPQVQSTPYINDYFKNNSIEDKKDGKDELPF